MSDDDEQSLFQILEEVDDLDEVFRDEPNVASLIAHDFGRAGPSGGESSVGDDEDEKQDLELLEGLLKRLKKRKTDDVPNVELTSRWKRMSEEDSLKYILEEINGALLNADDMKNRLLELEQRLIGIADQLLNDDNDSGNMNVSVPEKQPMGYPAKDPYKLFHSFKKPYFKTPTGFGTPIPPPVESFLPCEPDSLPLSLFNDRDVLAVNKAVLECVKTQMLKKAARDDNNKLIDEVTRLDEDGLNEILTESNELESQLDWEEVSSREELKHWLPEECKRFWALFLNPRINKKRWSNDELEALASLAETHSYQNWDDIAVELKTSRTGYQCFVQYHTKLDKERRRPWNDFDTEAFNKILPMCTYGSHVLWSKVCYFLETRTPKQVLKKHLTLHSTRKKGAFSLEEDEFIMKNFSKIKHVGPKKSMGRNLERDPSQVKNRLRDNLTMIMKCRYNEWTEEEDRKILRLYETFKLDPNCFSLMSKHLKTRNRHQVRHRYNRLKTLLNGEPRPEDVSSIRRLKMSVGNERRTKILQLAHELEFSCGESSVEGSDTDESDEDEEDSAIMKFFQDDRFPVNVKLKTRDLEQHASQMKSALRFIYENNRLPIIDSTQLKLPHENDHVYGKILNEIFKRKASFGRTQDQPSTSTASLAPTVEPLFPDIVSIEALDQIFTNFKDSDITECQKRVNRMRQRNEAPNWFAVNEIIFTWPLLLSVLTKKQEEEVMKKLNP